jgi:hypothetical protein
VAGEVVAWRAVTVVRRARVGRLPLLGYACGDEQSIYLECSEKPVSIRIIK